jgi:GNAT superfamily N-acetyltransferase
MSMVAYRSSLELHSITPDDEDSVLDVYRQCEDFLALGPEPKASLDMVLKDIETTRNEGGVFRGIFSAGRMIGVVSYIPRDFEGKPDVAFLSLLMIAAPYRRHGIGTQIVKRIEKEILRYSHITRILSGVQVNNPDALLFWQKNGYIIVGGPELLPDKTTVFHLCKECKPLNT